MNIQKAYEGKKPYIFASYVQHDADQVFPIIAALQEQGFRVWYNTNTSYGEDQQEDVAQHLFDCTIFLTFISENSLNSSNLRQEINFSIELNKGRLAIYLDEAQMSLGMQMRLGIMQNIYYTRHSTQESFLDELCRSQVLSPCRGTPEHFTAGEAYNKGMRFYENGSYGEAVSWLRAAAEQGHIEAQYQMARCYDAGLGVQKSSSETNKWLLKAAEQGHAKAQCNLGRIYFEGLGVVKNYPEALKWYRKSAEQGNVDAQCGMGVVLLYGESIRDPVESVRCFQKAARQGSSYAQEILMNLNLPW